MSNNHISSSEFATLCQSQIALLSQIGAVWSVIYLTEEISEDGQAQLFPFTIYPQTQNQSFFELPPIKLPEIWQRIRSHSIAQLLPDNLVAEEGKSTKSTWTPDTKQIILPLIHQEAFIGLLVAGREDREWRKKELQQVEEIARTIAVARFIELQYHWTRDKLAIQENLRRVEHDRLDNLLHQLRNPLTALRTFGKLLIKRLLPGNPNHQLVENILAQGERFTELLEQFEAEAKNFQAAETTASDSNSLLLAADDNQVNQSSFLLPSATELNPVNLKQILEPLLHTAKAIALARNIELLDNVPASIPMVRGDFLAIREILDNLVDNALKYTSPGGKVKLELKEKHSANESQMLGVVIGDTGCGIPAADRERIFERHYRGIQAESDIPGSGLGLAIALELVTKMQGEIELISPNNLAENTSGTTFIVWLPLAIDK
ncbi:GAF domain-containing sensor histidine kinase [Pleurocapsales cyanobacterium LEGE 10410]|nr:GAF domain-containing sensor histidine kinase [Pleurocapsales cyanobacterium LEGE 10410]